MPFKSEAQRKYLWANEPGIARDWTDKHGSGIAKALGGRIGFQEAGKVDSVKHAIMLEQIDKLEKMIASGLDADGKLQARLDQLEATPTTGLGTGPELKDPVKDPVPESRISPEQRAGIREMMAARSGDYSGLGPHRGMPLSAEDRQTYLAELLENDPASNLYDLSTVKDFSEEENRGRKARMSRGVEGYYSDGTAYVKDLDKLGTRVGPFKDSLADQKLAAIASHELTHPKVEKYNIDMSNIEEPRELPSGGYLHDRTYMPHEKEELLTRMIEMQNFPKTSDAEWYFGQSPYAISKHPSGAEGYEAGKILQRSLEPSLQKYNQLIEAEKNPLIYDEATGYNRSDLQRLGLASIGPHGWDYDEDDPYLDRNRINTVSQPRDMMASLRNRFYKPATSAAGGYNVSQLNQMNALGGYYSEPARAQRRNQARVNNMMARKAAGKSYSKTNLANLSGGDTSTSGDYHSGHQSTVDGQTTDWGPNSAMIARGGLAQYAPRGSYFNGGLASLYRHGRF